MHLANHLKTWARTVKRDGVTLWFAARHPQAPWYAKALGVFVVAYALSPIDLIPDFIPVLGYLDDVLLLPGLIWLVIRLIPAPVLQECREQADQWIKTEGGKPVSRIGVVLIVACWIGAGLALWHWWVRPWLAA
ncbi:MULTISPECIES: YkvA family protein [unclassified Acidovorax]|uniref:YkvA family protein n=1 Tax=unclassified Acidovorax TaxID=2684926 RepID=UPI000B3FED0B|nr:MULTISPECIES: YkvA family protein [unclassified Acidovorax]